MRLPTTSVDARFNFSKISLGLAVTPEEIREAQRLRYKVFTNAMRLSAIAGPNGLDQDELDAYCDHLIVRDMRTLKVVGAYRVLGPRAAARCGRLHAEHAFDLDRLQ